MNFETRLWASAAQDAREAGMEFTVPCSRNVKDLIRAGVSVMRRENRITEADQDEAVAGLSRLAGEMIRVTRELGEAAAPGGKFNIRETALVRAKRERPLWPFG